MIIIKIQCNQCKKTRWNLNSKTFQQSDLFIVCQIMILMIFYLSSSSSSSFTSSSTGQLKISLGCADYTFPWHSLRHLERVTLLKRIIWTLIKTRMFCALCRSQFNFINITVLWCFNLQLNQSFHNFIKHVLKQSLVHWY